MFNGGSLGFLFGSICYYDFLAYWTAGAYLYVFGSVCFTLGDLHEWSHLRAGCCGSTRMGDIIESENEFVYSNGTLAGAVERGISGTNAFMSFLGSLFYLVGSVLLIHWDRPDCIKLGSWMLLIASFFVMSSQCLKVWRGCPDMPAFILETNALFGGACYLVGSAQFLPRYNDSISTENIAATWFTVGSLFFVVGGCTLAFRHLCWSQNPIPFDSYGHSTELTDRHVTDPLICTEKV